jgi:hypothetical protein
MKLLGNCDDTLLEWWCRTWIGLVALPAASAVVVLLAPVAFGAGVGYVVARVVEAFDDERQPDIH